MIKVVLVEPGNSGNVGAIARVMGNFSFRQRGQLVLVNPKCNHLSQTARNRAKHAQNVLKNARITDSSYLQQLDYVIGTTAKLGRDYNIPRAPLSPSEARQLIAQHRNLKIGLLFGRERSGLTNQEVERCDFVVHIPTANSYPTLNISHAVSVLLYEVFRASGQRRLDQEFAPATKKEKQLILQLIDRSLDRLDFPTQSKRETQRKVWRRIMGKSFLTKREAFAVIGYFKKLNR